MSRSHAISQQPKSILFAAFDQNETKAELWSWRCYDIDYRNEGKARGAKAIERADSHEAKRNVVDVITTLERARFERENAPCVDGIERCYGPCGECNPEGTCEDCGVVKRESDMRSLGSGRYTCDSCAERYQTIKAAAFACYQFGQEVAGDCLNSLVESSYTSDSKMEESLLFARKMVLLTHKFRNDRHNAMMQQAASYLTQVAYGV